MQCDVMWCDVMWCNVMYVCMHVCMYDIVYTHMYIVYIYICKFIVYIYICIYIYTQIYIHIWHINVWNAIDRVGKTRILFSTSGTPSFGFWSCRAKSPRFPYWGSASLENWTMVRFTELDDGIILKVNTMVSDFLLL